VLSSADKCWQELCRRATSARQVTCTPLQFARAPRRHGERVRCKASGSSGSVLQRHADSMCAAAACATTPARSAGRRCTPTKARRRARPADKGARRAGRGAGQAGAAADRAGGLRPHLRAARRAAGGGAGRGRRLAARAPARVHGAATRGPAAPAQATPLHAWRSRACRDTALSRRPCTGVG